MGNKAIDFYVIDVQMFKVVYDKDYCSTCADFISKMRDHEKAHFLNCKDLFEQAWKFY